MPRSTVLLVEDCPEDAAVVARLIRLAEPDCDVAICNSGEQALDWLWRRTPSLVLLDIALPGTTDGLEVLQRVKQNPCTVDFPVVVVSGTLKDSVADPCRTAGAADVVRKETDQHAFGQKLVAAARPWLRAGA